MRVTEENLAQWVVIAVTTALVVLKSLGLL